MCKESWKGFPWYFRGLLIGRSGEWSWSTTWLPIVCNNLLSRVPGIRRRKPSNLLLYRKSCEVWGKNSSNMKRFNRHSIYTVAQKCHGNFNLLTATSICSRQFQFLHGNFNLLTAISMCSRQFQFIPGNFNLFTAISIDSRQFQFLEQ